MLEKQGAAPRKDKVLLSQLNAVHFNDTSQVTDTDGNLMLSGKISKLIGLF